jgi:hypothetical protein
MAGFSDYAEPKILDCLFNNTAFGAVANVYLKLHVGATGDAGTTNAAANTTRVEVTFGAASGGTISNDAAINWTSVSNSEDYTHGSLWDHLTAGNCLFTEIAITANAVTAGDNFSIPIGDLDLTLD